ncbi:MAG: hypothetical protein RLP02_04545 [Coleofasciculus sp. C2-GNP5-27]
MTAQDWWRHAVIYQVYIRSFRDSKPLFAMATVSRSYTNKVRLRGLAL